jgi:hypothetical protein
MNIFLSMVIIAVTVLLFPLRGNAMGEAQKKEQKIQEAYKNINLSDGVSKEEALIIAKHFVINDPGTLSSDVIINSAEVGESGLKNVIGDCWAVGFDAKWKVKRRTGLKWFTVHIDKLTGEIKTRGWGPS